MFLKTIRQLFVMTCLTLAALTVVGTSLSLAAKPGGGGGGGGGSTGGGTIYFGARDANGAYRLHSMNSDGSGKTALPLSGAGSPSQLLHGGHRWFVSPLAIEREKYPDGLYRYEQLAYRDDGNEGVSIQLTDDPAFQLIGRWSWAPGETTDTGLIGGFGRRWVFDGVDWVVDPATVGIYTATVLFDLQGNVLGLEAPPAFLASVGVVDGNWPDAYYRFDWSPDLTEVVYKSDDWSAFRILNLLTGEIRTLTTGGLGGDPRWSPAGNLIVFNSGVGSIETIAPDGTGRREVIRWGVSYGYYYPEFSPTGSHILYNRIPHGSLESDLYRATPSGSNKVNLTSGIAGPETSYGWR
jgi:hypothetical protein